MDTAFAAHCTVKPERLIHPDHYVFEIVIYDFQAFVHDSFLLLSFVGIPLSGLPQSNLCAAPSLLSLAVSFQLRLQSGADAQAHISISGPESSIPDQLIYQISYILKGSVTISPVMPEPKDAVFAADAFRHIAGVDIFLRPVLYRARISPIISSLRESR